ncbi:MULTISPECIES: amidohydrolase family protein [Oscillospiraceae]|uniref:Amidohydrolase-related domain-containing protein n=1 Tax=Harryflintia acetispora TaxID=1849041 RepID=A0A9X8ULV2_9FIRM|nr:MULTISPECIES: amidohydrolase family protein [Oscillospiraceae]RGB69958.1 amidohydrolase [Harryflintia acetispora]TCL44746.1 hypothetical protein EDD78_102372 [Harryflintia acetispora]
MVIDVHVHPGFYGTISKDPGEVELRKKAAGWDLMSPHPEKVTFTQMDAFGVDKLVLLPLDLTTTMGGWVCTNEEIKTLVDLAPERFIGFASVDPRRKDAPEVLEHAFKNLGLCGLKLNPCKQAFFPADPMMDPIYKLCQKYNKPIMFHAGMSWEPNCLMKYGHPLNFEEVAQRYPEVRMCMAHFGWPWAVETAALILKYPNLYTDTAALYMDSPEAFMDQIFNRTWGPLWFEHNFADKVMFGSNNPRFRSARIKRGLDSIEMREETREKLLGGNALRFLGMEG